MTDHSPAPGKTVDLDEIERCARYVTVPEDQTKRRQAFNDYFMAVDPNTILAMIAELRAAREVAK